MRVNNLPEDTNNPSPSSKSFLESELDAFGEGGSSFLEEDIDLDKLFGDDVENIPKEESKSKKEPTKGKSKNLGGTSRTSKGTKTKNKKSTSSKKKGKKQKNESALPPLKAGRIVGTVFMGILFSTVLSGVVYAGYMNYIKYPAQMEVIDEKTGIYCIRNWEQQIYSLDSLGKESYLTQEITYANDNKDKIAFLKKIASTISYTPKQVKAKNVYGNIMINRKDDSVVYTDSTLNIGEEVTLSYIDYAKVKPKRGVVEELMKDADLHVGDVDYTNKLIDVFCKYISSLDKDDIPLTNEKHVPNMILNKNGTFSMTKEEDIYIDKLLYSSEDLYDLMERFSVVAGSIGVKNPKWDEWNKLSAEEKKDKKNHKEPSKELKELQPTKDWLEWDKLEAKDKTGKDEPVKYNWKDIMNKLWCGAYYLQNEYEQTDSNGNKIKTKITAEVGDGTFKDPAGMKTSVLTSIFVNEEGKDGIPVVHEYPIKVRMVEYGVSEEAIKWFEGKDEQNRGIDLESEVQFCYYVFEVTNMADKELVISDNSTLCDSNANVASRTGIIYGLQDSVKLKPDETGTIETWGRSTELNKRYVIWGKDFARRVEPIWFRVLAGNIDDPSEDKGVHLNKSRHSEEENEDESEVSGSEQDVPEE